MSLGSVVVARLGAPATGADGPGSVPAGATSPPATAAPTFGGCRSNAALLQRSVSLLHWHHHCQALRVAISTLFHEAPLDVLREHPQVLLELLALGEVQLPLSSQTTVTVLESTAIEVVPAHRHADFVAELRDTADGPLGAIVILEVQRRADPEKPRAWIQMVASALGRHAVRVVLVVLTFDEATASWARQPRDEGALVLRPIVLGPRDLPHLVSIDYAREHLLLAVLVALARSAEVAARGPRSLTAEAEADVLRAAEAVTELTDLRLRQRLASLIEGAAPAEIRANILRLLEERGMRSLEIIREEGRNEGRAEGRNEGRAEGEARTLLKLLRLRGFAVDDATAERVLGTTDVSMLDRWVERSISASSLEEVLEG